MTDVTQILKRIESGDPTASEQLLPVIYDALRELAAARLAKERPGQTLQPTALVHEAYLRLVDVEKPQSWYSRGHFFAAASEAMRRILVEQARKRIRQENIRGKQIPLDELATIDSFADENLVQLNDALEKLGNRNAEAAAIVKLRFFGGLTMKEAAEAQSIPLRTAERNWTYARAWLHRELEQSMPNSHSDHA